MAKRKFKKRSTAQKVSKGGSLHINYYVVCIVDILGQAQRLTDWSQLPTDQSCQPAFIEALQDTVGSVLWFKRTFSDLFHGFAKINLSAEQRNALNSSQWKLFKRFKNCHLGIQQFSDTFVFYAPLTNDHGDVTSTPLHRILAACSIGMLSSLAAQMPLRGAVCISSGTELESGNFYGPALARAHHIESEVAKYPRVVVADEVVRFVRATQGFSHDQTINSVMAALTKTCKPMICQDHDDQAIVDFLGRGIRDMVGPNDSEISASVVQGYEFVCSQVNHFENVGDAKHVERYRRLKQYVESRLSLWGTSAGG